MKKYLFAIIISSVTMLQAQSSSTGKIGINTDNPQRSLDVNGNLKISSLDRKDINDTNFQDLLVTHNDDGKIDKIKINDLQINTVKNIEVNRVIYINKTPLDTKECSCGDITFKIDNTSTPKIKLNSEEPLKKANLNSFTTDYGVKTWYDTSYDYYNRSENNGLSFNLTNYNNYRSLDNNNALVNNNVIKIYNLILPKQNNFYRLTISRTRNSLEKDIFSLVCEKFFVESLN